MMDLRAELRAAIASGNAWCPFCGLPIVPGQKWDIDHRVPRRHLDPAQLYDRALLRPAHASCNRRAGASQGNRERPRRAAAPRARCAGCTDPIPAGGWLCARCEAVVAGV